ncbi:MAG: hypothetical protein NW223_16155 [Hyphomicrobiaceae bacterium]|nr:hypothetical protein [Hyphomicrobiaceae bacterium]
MTTSLRIRARRVETEADRLKALEILKVTYQEEKAWVADAQSQFPARDLDRADVSWFIATSRDEPLGVLRVLYDPPVAQYLSYGLSPIDVDLRIEDMIRNERIAEIGRFAVRPNLRSHLLVASRLMGAATREIVSRQYTQLITDVFEADRHSPFGFHTRVIGFKPIATHEIGELLYKGRRITLVLDIKAAYQRLKARGNWFFRNMTHGWTETMHKQLAA